MKPLTIEDAAKLLAKLEPVWNDIVLIGGQALNFWAEHYQRESRALAKQAPFTSKDIDLCASAAVARECGRLLKGRTKTPTPDDATSHTGLVVYTDDAGNERQLDFLETSFGIPREQVHARSIPIEVDAIPFRVIQPVDVLESRVHNVIGLPRRASTR